MISKEKNKLFEKHKIRLEFYQKTYAKKSR